VSNRVSQTILLCEDDPQDQIVRFYMQQCKLSTTDPPLRRLIASRQSFGGNVHWVLQNFSKQLEACRQRAVRAKTLLIVVLDADDFSVVERRHQLNANPPPSADDPLVMLIPRRHIETWIRAALGEQVDETGDYKHPKPAMSDIRNAGVQIYRWARDQPLPGPNCVMSLRDAFREWRKIG
jgi:hypothetical protein